MRKIAKKTSTAQLEKQIEELTGALQRERADAINVRRRANQERLQLATLHKIMIVRQILPVIDNCERLLEHISSLSKAGPWKEGAEKIVEQSRRVLADLGVERIKTIGERFDPHLHEAVHMDESSDPAAAGIEVVCEELASGYRLGDEVIRHAMVKVKKG